MPWFIVMVLVGFSNAAAARNLAPEGEYENSACLDCHQQESAGLVSAWHDSLHSQPGKIASCVACHGNSHEKAASHARRDTTCIECHGGKADPVVHSYTTSKHGILVRLEQSEWDWEQPLEAANYRAPGCAYCHMHGGNHEIGNMIQPWQPEQAASTSVRENVQDAVREVCQDCHAPRYVTTLFENGDRMLEIGRMKVREASVMMDEAREFHKSAALEDAEKIFLEMKTQHLKNVYLGIAHQSPDYQWWHGQPALDGDLLRIRGAIDEARRLKVIDSLKGIKGLTR